MLPHVTLLPRGEAEAQEGVGWAMNRNARVGGSVALVMAVIGVVILVLRGGTTTVVVDDHPPVDPPADGSAVIGILRASGGLAPLGIRLIDPTHTVEVQFLTGPGCSERLTPGQAWPTDVPECATGVSLTGTVGGLGTTISGQSLVGVTFSVSRGCYGRLEVGMPWPTTYPECGPEKSAYRLAPTRRTVSAASDPSAESGNG